MTSPDLETAVALKQQLEQLKCDLAAIEQRQSESEYALVTALNKQKAKVSERSQIQNMLIGLVVFLIVLAVSGASLKGKLGDTEFGYSASTEDILRILAALSSGGAAIGGAAFMARKDDEPNQS